jgi:hypothetical protein
LLVPGRVLLERLIGQDKVDVVMILVTFVVLQALDLITTLLFLQNGVAEGNPLMRAAFRWFANPLIALGLAKTFAIVLAILAWRSGRRGLLSRINRLFALFVVWNLLAGWVGGSGA